MKFGPVPVRDAEGAILAHSVRAGATTIRKGRTLTPDDVMVLTAAGVAEVVVAQLDADDVHEDAAAAEIAAAVAGAGVRTERPFTGRVNLFAEAAGLVLIDRTAVDALNRVDPAVTLATVPAFAEVAAGQMIATVKIIPFAVSRPVLDVVRSVAAKVSIAPFRPKVVGLVATTLPSLKPSVMDKTRRSLEMRLAAAGARLLREDRVPHDAEAVGEATRSQIADGADIVVVFGASAVVDAEDVIPAAIIEAGGVVERIGMPVDPGNLLVLGRVGDAPVVGAPGCARSPKQNGFDWILQRLLAGIPVTSDDIAGLGVGGLLAEIATRPQPRIADAPRIAAVLLAAGSSRRMGGVNKLTATIEGKPLVRLAAEAAVGSVAVSLTVVTGHAPEAVRNALTGIDATLVHNPEHEGGLSTSLRAGLAALPDDIDGAVVLLGDMPDISGATIDRLIAAFGKDRIVVPTHAGQRGNPVIWPRRFFADLMAVTGDKGGRAIIDANPGAVVPVELGLEISTDVDTPDALAAARGRHD